MRTGIGYPASALSQCVVELLDRNGIPPRDRIRKLQAVLHLTYAQVNRRLHSENRWNIEEILALASHFNEPWARLLMGLGGGDLGQTAIVLMNGVSWPCWVWTEPKGVVTTGRPLVAVPREAPQPWLVVPAADAQDQDFRSISRLMIETPVTKRFGILGNPNGILNFMQAVSASTMSFKTARDLVAQMSEVEFDGFLLDWTMFEQPSALEDTLVSIREHNRSAPIALMSGPTDRMFPVDKLVKWTRAHQVMFFTEHTALMQVYEALRNPAVVTRGTLAKDVPEAVGHS